MPIRHITAVAVYAAFLVLAGGFAARPAEAAAATPGAHKRVFFIHHSTGEIYWNNGLESKLQAAGYSTNAPWWDGGTDPQDFYDLFNDPASWDKFGNADIIMFKSCFPASDITSKAMLKQYRAWYRRLYAVYKAHPDVLFVAMSTPPLPKE
ncbi:MAG: hypothetical protein ABIG66_03880, partial [Candidatus Kerfeldbacteria bacterium]